MRQTNAKGDYHVGHTCPTCGKVWAKGGQLSTHIAAAHPGKPLSGGTAKTNSPRQARFRQELKRLLKRGVPAAKAMKTAWKRVPKNPRRGGRRRATAKEVMARVPSSAIYRTLVRFGVAPAAAASAVGKDFAGKNPRRPYDEAAAKRSLEAERRAMEKRTFFCPTCKSWQLRASHKHNPTTRAKAREILHHGHARGYALTAGQRGLLGAVASGYPLREYTNPPPIKLLANGRLVGLIGFRPTRGRKIHRNPSIDIRV